MIKRTLIGGAIFIALLFLLLILVPVFFSGQVKGMIEKQVNAQMTAEMKLNGNAEISLLSHFPNASVSFHDILIINSGEKTDTLLQTNRLSFLFNPFDMLRGQYNVEKVSMGDAILNLHADAAGHTNYDILVDNGSDTISTGSSEDLSLDIKELTFQSIEVYYLNENQQQEVKFTLSNGLLSLGYEESQTDILLKADLVPGRLLLGDATYVLPKSIGISGGININEEKSVYRFSNTRFVVDGDTYELEGLLEEKPYGLWIDIITKGKEISLGSLWSLASQTGIGKEWNLDSDGELDFSATVRGPMGTGRVPKVEALLHLKDGNISSSVIDGDIKSVELVTFFSNGENQNMASSIVELRKWNGELKGFPFKIEGTVRNLDQPRISATIDGTFDGDAINELLEDFGIKGLTGRVHFSDIKIQSDLKERTDVNGDLSLNNVSFDWNNYPFHAESGTLHFQNRNVAVDINRWQAGASDFSIKGNLKQWPSLFIAGSSTYPTVKAEVNATYHDWVELIDIFTIPSSDSTSLAAPSNYLQYLRQIRGDVKYSCRKLSAGTFNADEAVTHATLRPYLLTIDSASMRTSEGFLELTSTGRYLNDRLVMESRLKGKDIDIKKLFTSFDNFWQDYLVDDNLDGRVEGTVNGILVFDQELELLTDEIDLEGNLTVTDGELKDFEPLKQLSAFVKVDELEDIKFSTLKNIVLIKGDRVMLPVMAIKSTAMNMWLSGEYFYDETIDYQFKIDLMDVLARKFSIGGISLRDAELRKEGLVNLYVSMTGDIDDPDIEMNKRRVRERFYEMNLVRGDDFIEYDEIDQRQQKHSFNPRKSEGGGDLEFIDEW